jgi:hypothetical protein
VTRFGDAFLLMHWQLDGELRFAIGRSDVNEAYTALYRDDRGV